MNKFRILFFAILIMFLPGFTCFRLSGVQILTYHFSSCPEQTFKLPNFSETTDLILTQQHDRLTCEGYTPYSIMKKEGHLEKISFFAKFEKKEDRCSIKILTKRYCDLVCEGCLEGETKIFDLPQYDIKKLIPEFLFMNEKITVTDLLESEILTGENYKKLCNGEF